MRAGFSLVELSIVLVILGLLTGGILAGQNLIHAAELRSATTQFSSYQTAVFTFRDKYFALPGDMPNAEQFWGTMATGTCPNATAGTGTQTCNGNGDGNITFGAGGGQTKEIFTFWQHLANAGLIEGTYTGIAGANATGADAVIGTNSPAAKMGNAGWSTQTLVSGVGDADMWANRQGTYLIMGTKSATSITHGPVFKPEDAWNIDTKLDDGMPGIGKILGRYWNNLCSAPLTSPPTNTDYTAKYRITDSTARCALYLKVM